MRTDKKGITQSKIMAALDYAYDKSIGGIGIPGMDSSSDLANSYLQQEGTLKEQINSLIRWQNTKSATTGFITGLGGVITMPVSIPANIASIIFVQVRMIAAIATMCGYDVKNDKVKALVYTCLAGNASKELLKEAGVIVGRKLTESAIKSISGRTILKINKIVGFRLLTKFGEKGVINLVKVVPFVGGIVGGSIDAAATNVIGNVARDTFIELNSKNIKI